jgi:hypothetical protein
MGNKPLNTDQIRSQEMLDVLFYWLTLCNDRDLVDVPILARSACVEECSQVSTNIISQVWLKCLSYRILSVLTSNFSISLVLKFEVTTGRMCECMYICKLQVYNYFT